MSCSTDRPNIYIGVSNVEVKETTYKDVVYTRTYYGNLVNSTFTESSYPEWDETKRDYKIGDRVKISDLKAVYVCGKDGTMQYPPSTTDWLVDTDNSYRFLDDIPTTKSISTDNTVEVVFNAIAQTHIVGLFIDNVEHIEFWRLNDDLTENELLDTINMTQYIDFTCFKCCNPPPIKKRNFVYKLDKIECGEKYIKVKLFKSTGNIQVGTLTVTRAISAGIMLNDPKINTNKNIKFEHNRLTRNVSTYTVGQTIEANVDCLINAKDKRVLWNYYLEHNSLLFLLAEVEQLEILESVIVGTLTLPNGFSIRLDRDTEYKLNFKGVLA